MSWLPQSAETELTYRLGWALLHSVWQGIVAAGILLLLLRLMRKASAGLRYLCGLTALFSVMVAAIVTGTLVHSPARQITLNDVATSNVSLQSYQPPVGFSSSVEIPRYAKQPSWNERKI